MSALMSNVSPDHRSAEMSETRSPVRCAKSRKTHTRKFQGNLYSHGNEFGLIFGKFAERPNFPNLFLGTLSKPLGVGKGIFANFPNFIPISLR